MDSKKVLSTKIISIISLIVLGYIFFISVYNQIIVQSGGFFFVIIFGGILILAFVLLSLVTKLIEITSEIKDNFMWNFVEILLICNLAYLFFAFRLSYHSSVPAEETIIYRAASLMRAGEMGDKGMDMFNHLILYPSQYVYAAVLSVFMGIADSGSRAMITLNAIVLILTAFVMDRVVRKIAGRACGVIAALCTLFIPSQSFAVYSYSSEFFFCLILLIAMDLFLILIGTEEHDANKELIVSSLLGAVTALLCFTEPLMIICVIIFAVYFVLLKKGEGSIRIKPVAAMAGIAIAVLLILTLVKSMSLNTDIGSVISGSFSRFKLTRNLDTDEKYPIGEVFEHFHNNLDNQNTNVNDNYNFLVNEKGEAYSRTQNAWFSLGTQMSYMFVIVMSIACAFYMFKDKKKDAIPGFLLLIGCFLVLFFRSTDEASTFFMFQILIIAAGCGLYYMYMNHHPELYTVAVVETDDTGMEAATVADKDVSAWGSIARARALIFAGRGNSKNLLPDEGQSAVSSTPVATQVNNVDNISMAYNAPGTSSNASGVEEVTVSPEGYFSFFAMGNTKASAGTAGQVNAASAPQEQPVEYVEPAAEYAEPVTEYQEPVMEYTEPAAEYQEPVSEYAEPEAEYQEQVSEYTEPATEYQESVSEYEEPVAEHQESVSEYTEPVAEYQEPVTEYEEPVAEYQEQIPEYTETAEEYSESALEYQVPVTEYEEPVAEYQEEVQEYTEPVAEYQEEVQGYEEPAVGYQKQPAGSYDNGTKTSYGSAAHALGFSFSNEFFEDTDNASETEVDMYAEATVYEGTTMGSAIETEMDEPEFDIFGNEIPYEETIQQTVTDEAHKPYYASEDEEVTVEKMPAYKFAGNYDSDVDEYSFGESMPDMFAFEEPAPAAPEPQPEVQPELRPEVQSESRPIVQPVNTAVQNATAATGTASVAPVKKKKVVKKVVRRVVKKSAPQAGTEEPQPVNVNAEFLQDKELMDIASGYENAALDISAYDEEIPPQDVSLTDGMPSLIKENLHKLAQANVPVPDMDTNINDIISSEADARYNFDDDDGEGGNGSGYVIEI